MKRNWFYSLAYVVLWPVVHLLFLPVVQGRERIPQGNAVFCCNHSSNWDPLLIMVTAGYGHQLFALAKAEISRWPVVGWILKTAGMIFVDRGKADICAIKSFLGNPICPGLREKRERRKSTRKLQTKRCGGSMPCGRR